MKFSKTYQLTDLLDDRRSIEKRIKQIEHITSSYPFFPTTEFTWESTYLILLQDKIERLRHYSKWKSYQKLARIAQYLDNIADYGFVHGDINRKNVLWAKDENLYIVDLEPSLRQIRKGRATWMVTYPHVSSFDLEHGTITTNTDKIGYYDLLKVYSNIDPKLSEQEVISQSFAKIAACFLQKRALN